MVVYYYCIFPTFDLHPFYQSQIWCCDVYASHTPQAVVPMPFAPRNHAGKWAQPSQESKIPSSMHGPPALLLPRHTPQKRLSMKAKKTAKCSQNDLFMTYSKTKIF